MTCFLVWEVQCILISSIGIHITCLALILEREIHWMFAGIVYSQSCAFLFQVNKIRELPDNPSIVATHSDSKEIFIWHFDRQPHRGDKVAASFLFTLHPVAMMWMSFTSKNMVVWLWQWLCWLLTIFSLALADLSSLVVVPLTGHLTYGAIDYTYGAEGWQEALHTWPDIDWSHRECRVCSQY